MAQQVLLLAEDATPWKNLGALRQHLMNVVGDPALHITHMQAMVTAYRTFVILSRRTRPRHHRNAKDAAAPGSHESALYSQGETDPDVEILDKWVRDVEVWMKAEGHRVP